MGARGAGAAFDGVISAETKDKPPGPYVFAYFDNPHILIGKNNINRKPHKTGMQ